VSFQTEELFVRWSPDLQDAFVRLGQQHGWSRAARILDMPERAYWDLRHGMSRGGGKITRRKFLSTQMLGRIADALDDPELENREALPRRGWSERGEWRTVAA